MKNFILAIQFMTRIPININLDIKRDEFYQIVKFFPIVGLIIGLLEFCIYSILKIFLINTSIEVTAFITVLSHIIITGGMHIDGFSDTADGVFSGRDKNRILEIMKDSRVGTFGVLAIIILILGKIIFISNIKNPLSILLAPIISRTMNIFLMYKRKYARQVEGMGDMFIGALDKVNFILALTLCIIIMFIIYGINSFLIFAICVGFTLIFRNYIENKIAGITGDILGACDELNEILIYFIFII